MDIDDGVQPVVFARQQDLGLDAIDKGFRLLEVGRKLVGDRLTFAGKVDECSDVVQTPRYLAIEVEVFFEAGALLEDFAGAVLVGPEIRFRDLLLQFVELTLFRARVKETSGRPRYGFLIG